MSVLDRYNKEKSYHVVQENAYPQVQRKEDLER
jgi:hypothetical protein